MATKLRWGLLSTARINRSLIPPLRACPRSELVAVASRRLQAAREFAERWEIPRALGSYEELLADEGIDAIYNPLPNGLHAEWTIRAAEAGKHVLCEKPVGLSVDEVDAMTAAARRGGVVVAEAFMYRHHPQTRRVVELVREGRLGELRLVRGAFTFQLTREDDVRLVPELGGGSLWDVGCYPVSYARTLVGSEPLEVFGWQTTGPTGVDLAFSGEMRFRDGIRAQFDSGFNAPFRTTVEVVGSEASLTVPRAFGPDREARLLLRGSDDSVEEIDVSSEELYLYEVENFSDAALEGKPPNVTLADSRNNVATILALLQSAAEGQPVRLG